MSVPPETLQKFELFRGVSERTLSYLSQRCVLRSFYRGAIVADGYSGKLLLVKRGLVGVATLFIAPTDRPLTRPDVEKQSVIPLLSVYGRGDTCLELFVTNNPNLYAESLTDLTEVYILEREDVLFILGEDKVFTLNLLGLCGKVLSFVSLVVNALKYPSGERLNIILSTLPFSLTQEVLGRLCGMRRETVGRKLKRRKTHKTSN